MEFFGWLSGAVITILVLGFLLGFWRNWHKSLARLIIIAVVLTISIFSAPALSSLLLDKFSNGSVLNIFGLSFDFKEIITNFIGADIANDIAIADGITNDLIFSVMNVVMNLIIFIAMFIFLSILSLIIYWIVCGILHSKAKKEGKEKPLHNAAWWGLRSLGGVIGFISTMFVLFAFLSPVFGVMNVCNKFVEEDKSASAYSLEQTASAAGFESLTCGKLYYTDNKNIGKVEGYLETYSSLKAAYDSSAAGKIFNSLGISALGSKSFEYLSTVSHGRLELNLSEEFVSIAKAYNEYKKVFIQKDFDITNNNSVDGVVSIFENATNSKIVARYLETLLPTLCERWANDEAFLGMKLPLTEENEIYAPIVKTMLGVLRMSSIDRINVNVKVVLNAVKIANNNELLVKFREEDFDIMDYFANDTKFIEEEIENFASTSEFRNNMPAMFNNLFELLYNLVLEDKISFADNELTVEQIANINWESEAKQIQLLISNLAKFSKAISEEDNDGLLGNLTYLGVAIDSARASAMINKPLKTFMIKMIESNKVNMSDDVKETICRTIDESWDDPDCSFASLFEAIEKAATIAKNLASGNIDITILEGALADILNSTALKESIEKMVEDNVIGELVQDKQSAEVISGILTGFASSDKKIENVSDELKAAQIIVDIAKASKNEDGNFLGGETEEEKKIAAKEIVGNLNNSVIAIEILKKANSNDPADSAYDGIKDSIDSLSGLENKEDLKILQAEINALEDNNPNKALLQNLFCR